MSASTAIRGVLALVGFIAALHLLGLWQPGDIENLKTIQLAIEWIMILFLAMDFLPAAINRLVKDSRARSMMLDVTLILGLVLCITMTGQLNPEKDTTQVMLIMVGALACLMVFRKSVLPRILAKTGKKEVTDNGENNEEIQ